MYTPAHTHTHATGLHTPFTNHSWPNFNPAERLNGTRQAHVPSEDRQEADRPTVFGATHHCRCDVMELRVTPLPGKRFHSLEISFTQTQKHFRLMMPVPLSSYSAAKIHMH